MFELLIKNKEFLWDEQRGKGFNYIKEMLEYPTLLAHPKFDQPFIIQCDASSSAIAFMLAQVHDGQLRSVVFGGRVLSETEGRYAVTDKELLFSMFFCIKEMRDLCFRI